jgi:lipopolysaccharide export system protein LptC
MNGRVVSLLPLVVLAALGILTFWLTTIVQTPSVRADGKNRHDPDVIVDKFTAQMLSPEGQVQYVLAAASMQHFPDDDSSELVNVVLTGQQPGQPNLRATAPRGRLLNGNDKIVLDGGVFMETSATAKLSAMTLTTPRLTVLMQENIASSVDGVRIVNADAIINAAKFELNNLTQIAKFERGSMTLKTRSKEKK